jgi:uroporphyrinogen decarboxylase
MIGKEAGMLHTETMSPRERVVKALNHEEPDRIPIDLGGFQTGIHKKAYQALIQHLDLEETIQDLDPVQQLAIPSEAVLEKLHADIRYVTAHGPEAFKGH